MDYFHVGTIELLQPNGVNLCAIAVKFRGCMKVFNAAVLVGLIGVAFSANAADTNPIKGAFEVQHSMRLSQYSERYEEHFRGSKLMQEKANMTEIGWASSKPLTQESRLTFEGNLAVGKARYTGSYMGGDYGDLTMSGLKRQKIEAKIIYTSAPSNWSGVELDAGIGYRMLRDKMSKIDGGYDRVNTLVYGQVGVARTMQFEQWDIRPSAHYKHLLHGNQYSDLYGGIDHRQKSGNGMELAISFVRKAAGQPMFEIKPFLRTWNIGRSNGSEVRPGVSMFEPENKTREAGIAATWYF